MKEELKRIVGEGRGAQESRNRVREYLQAQILGSLQRAGAFVPLAFQGGTALRFLFAIRRYSEDLDFALERRDRGYDFKAFLKAIEGDLLREGYAVGIKANDCKVVHSAFISFPGLLFEMGLSPHRNESLSVKVEVDTNPPEGAILETTLVRRHLTLRLQHHDRSSLLAGKIHAILQRTYPKGRDVYDLIWYLSDPTWPSPNLILLNNALQQSGWEEGEVDEVTWRALVRQRVETYDWERVVADVQPFLESPSEIDLVSRENADRVLRG
jgi:hypothetical protein